MLIKVYNIDIGCLSFWGTLPKPLRFLHRAVTVTNQTKIRNIIKLFRFKWN